MKKHIWLIAGVGLAGVAILVLIMRESSASSQLAMLPQPAEIPGGIPQYPAPPPLPPFTVNAPAYYLTQNLPPDRNLATPTDSTKKSGCGGCKKPCGNGDGKTVNFSQSFLRASVENARRAFSQVPSTSNLIEQFPPNLYPQLYQKGGTA